MENEVMQIIVFAGNAKSLGMQSIRLSKAGNMEEAREKLAEADTQLKEAHHAHAKILSAAAEKADSFELSLFIVHGEDHLMSAVTTIDLAKEFLDVNASLHEIKAELSKLRLASQASS